MRAFFAEKVSLPASMLVEASAGTGKTFAITTLLVRLVAQLDVRLDQVLVVTFTEAATAELRRRMRSRLQRAAEGLEPELVRTDIERARVKAALLQLDEAAVFTIHGFCQRVLADGAFESGRRFDLELSADTEGMTADILHDHLARRFRSLDLDEHRQLQGRGYRPASLATLLHLTASRPELRIVPAAEDDPAPPAPPSFDELFAELGAHWDPARIRPLVDPKTRMNHFRFVDDWIGKLDAFFRDGGAPPLKELERFTPPFLAGRTKKGQSPPEDPFFGAVEVFLRGYGVIDDHLEWRFRGALRDLIDEGRRELPKRLRAAGRLSFDGLLREVHEALLGARGSALAAMVRRRYPVALVDEFQDTDPVQYGIFRRIWPDDGLMLIGDPKQAIYAFRGADIYAYLDAAERVPTPRRFSMATNWRSDPKLVQAVNALFSRPAPFAMDDVAFVEVTAQPGARDVYTPDPEEGAAPLQLLWCPDKKADIAAGTAGLVARLLSGDHRIEGRRVVAEDIAVLTRTNGQAFDVQAALRAVGIPSVVMGDASVFAEKPAEALLQLMSAALEPADDRRLRASLLTPLFGVAPEALHRMGEDAAPPGETPANDNDLGAELRHGGAYEDWVERFRTWHALWVQRGVNVMLRSAWRDMQVFPRLLRRPDGERWVSDLSHLAERLHAAERDSHLGPAGLYHWFVTQRQEAPKDEASLRRLESDRPAVRINTVHRSKGLEYGVVICPFLWGGTIFMGEEGKRPTYHDDRRELCLDLRPSEEALARARSERLAENLRLLYVAVTRAAHRLYVVCRPGTAYSASALGYLLHGRPHPGLRDPDALRKQLDKRKPDALLVELQRLAASQPDRIEVSTWAAEPPDGFFGSRVAAPALSVRSASSRNLAWRTASFSHLTSGHHKSNRADGRDHDEQVSPAMSFRASETPIPLIDFPRGAKAGNFFHEVLEDLDFEDPSALGPRVKDKLTDYGFEARWAAPVEGALRDALHTPLSAGRSGFRLAQLPLHQRRDELPFVLPVGAACDPTQVAVAQGTQLALFFGGEAASPARAEPGQKLGRLTARRLASVFADFPSDAVPPSYADRIARLSFLPLAGFLKGYIDLVYRHDGRFFVVDYKSNHLGDTIEDYARVALPDAMARGHYFLQYHLYSLAVHRWLGQRVPDYDYDKHFGGVYYLFLKGMTPKAGPDFGVFYERPPRERLARLGELLDRPGGR